MSAQNVHAHEDRLLDFAYGELPASEAQVLEQHVQGCARCTKALADIRGVRTTMAQLSAEPAPDAGLESLLAYAEQAARRAAAGPEPKPSRWRRWLLPAVGVAMVSTFGLLSLTISQNLQLEPNLSQKAAPVAAKAEEWDKRQPTATMAPAPTAVKEASSEGAADALAAVSPAPMDEKFDRNQAEAELKGAARPSDWMNAGSGGALLERRRSYDDAPKKKVAKAVRDADNEFAPLEPAAGALPAEMASSLKEEKSDGYLAGKVVPAPRRATAAGADTALAAKDDSLRLGAKAYGRGLAADDADEGGASASASPPPPAAAAPQAQSVTMAPGTPGSIGGAAPPEPASPRASTAKPVPVGKAASDKAMTARDLSAQAQAAAERGDRASEARLLRAALAAGANGSERLALLSRLCESESVQGRTREAAAVCGQIISEAPDSSAAQLAQRRLRQATPPAAPSKAAPAQPAQ
ncbi:anti-sigma factor [Corallococcus sp. EGB]|uniref:anti-sigma factor family protein n=1 Tax=Corallococcus sp. EGB TaxID=1521117 RepID=UPI001CBB151B|nr:zf-HC2 domain-containing protein [Corallococcus sp. EGB]